MSVSRNFLRMWAAVLLLTGGASASASAGEELLGRITVGDIGVTILSDGYRDMDAKLFLTPNPGQAEAVAAIYPQGTTRNSLNTFLIQTAGRTVLVDTGGGVLLGPNAGGLPKALAAAGVAPEDITDVIITHVHRDHIGGLGPNGKAAFPNATLHLSTAERDFWLNPEKQAQAPERARSTFATTREMLALYPGKVRTFDADQEVLPGIRSLAAFGHTPGHMALLVHSQGANLLIWGDLLHGMDLQLARPDIAISFDSDPVQAIASRKALLSRAASEGWAVTGVHVPGPQAYRIQAKGDGYAVVR